MVSLKNLLSPVPTFDVKHKDRIPILEIFENFLLEILRTQLDQGVKQQ